MEELAIALLVGLVVVVPVAVVAMALHDDPNRAAVLDYMLRRLGVRR